jgi:capsular polysaccharide biosynthesis protein
MELRLYLHILRQRWWIVAAVPLLVALISALVAFGRPPRYGLTLRLLVTRASLAGDDTAGLTDQGEDKTALDLPAILSGAIFRRDLAAELARRGRPLADAELVGALKAERQEHVVTVAVEAARAEDAVAIGQAVVALIKTNGLGYWGDSRATPDQPGLNVGVLDLPEQAILLNGPRAIAIDTALRALLALIAAVAIVFALRSLEAARNAQTPETLASREVRGGPSALP